MSYAVCPDSLLLIVLAIISPPIAKDCFPKKTGHVSWWIYLSLLSHQSSLYQELWFSWQAPHTPQIRAERRRVLLALQCQQRSCVTASLSLSSHYGYTIPEWHSNFPKNSKYFILLAKQESWIFLMLLGYNSSCDRSWWLRHLLCSLGSNWISSAALQSAVQQGSWCWSCCPGHFPGEWYTATPSLHNEHCKHTPRMVLSCRTLKRVQLIEMQESISDPSSAELGFCPHCCTTVFIWKEVINNSPLCASACRFMGESSPLVYGTSETEISRGIHEKPPKGKGLTQSQC